MTDDLDVEVPAGRPAGDVSVRTFAPRVKETPDSVIRQWVSYLLLALLAGIVVAAFWALFIINGQPVRGIADDPAADAKRLMDLMNVVFGPIVTLFSSVVGFYFGARTAKESGG